MKVTMIYCRDYAVKYLEKWGFEITNIQCESNEGIIEQALAANADMVIISPTIGAKNIVANALSSAGKDVIYADWGVGHPRHSSFDCYCLCCHGELVVDRILYGPNNKR